MDKTLKRACTQPGKTSKDLERRLDTKVSAPWQSCPKQKVCDAAISVRSLLPQSSLTDFWRETPPANRARDSVVPKTFCGNACFMLLTCACGRNLQFVCLPWILQYTRPRATPSLRLSQRQAKILVCFPFLAHRFPLVFCVCCLTVCQNLVFPLWAHTENQPQCGELWG